MGILLKKHLSIRLDNYPRLVALIYFVCLGVYVKSRGAVDASPANYPMDRDRSTVIVSNHNARFDAMLLANLHQCDATYLAASRTSFFGRLIINSGLCSRFMEAGMALDTHEGREEWRHRLDTAYSRPMLLFPEGRVVQAPQTIITFQSHLLQGRKIKVVCKKCFYKSYFLDHPQMEIPFFKPPYSLLKNKSFWDSLIEGIPFLVSFVTIFHTEVIGILQLQGDETVEEINASLYSLYIDNGYRLVDMDQNLVKRLMQGLYH